MRTSEYIRVLIAGIGGGSLGLEIFKCLSLHGGYELIGCDISEKALGLYENGFKKTILLPNCDDYTYARNLLDLCRSENVKFVAPGAEKVHSILNQERNIFREAGIHLLINSKAVVDLCSNKLKTLLFLQQQGIPVPETRHVMSLSDCNGLIRYPYIVKPSEGAGASNLVFLAENEREINFFVGYLVRRGYKATVQQYIDSNDEYTIGVLSLPDGHVVGSIALRRFLESKLSISAQYGGRVISSGWSQGEIRDFSEVCRQAELIAKAVGSRWAINIQGRVDNTGIFYPFEINPRHSGTSYLRALAGFNEPHYLLQYLACASPLPELKIAEGYYIRGLTETAVPRAKIRGQS
jgi:carbamoyl-phosphate synthase large subunit